ncbi:MAG: DUF935 family protein [Vulcanimicrobiota bacterium]
MDSVSILGPDGLPLRRRVEAQPVNLPLNSNWWHWLGNYAEGYHNPDKITVEQYLYMADTDETVFSGLQFLVMSVLSRLGDYTHPDTGIEEFVRRNFQEMEGSLQQGVEEILTALAVGFSGTEILWRWREGRVWLRGLQTLHPDTLTVDLHRAGPDKNKLAKVWQHWRSQENVEIPLNKLIWYKHKGYFGQPYGRSRLKSAYKSWFIKEVILKVWARTCERYGSPYTVAQVKQANAQVQHPVTKATVSAFQYLGEVLDSMASTGSLVLPDTVEAQILYAPTRFGEDFESLVAYCNRMIYRALGLPSLIADNGQTGSYSLGKQHFKLFVLELEQLLNDLIETLIEQLVRPLIDMNFGPQEHYGDFTTENFEAEDEQMIAAAIKDLTEAGALSQDRIDDVNWMRERVGLPLLTEEDLDPFVPDPFPVDTPDEETELSEVESERFCCSWAARRRRRKAARAARRRRIA